MFQVLAIADYKNDRVPQTDEVVIALLSSRTSQLLSENLKHQSEYESRYDNGNVRFVS